MNTRFFLGANSGSGFYSLYDGFAKADGDFLYHIKGGPGCGKSGFMQAIARKAESLQLDVECILCSGDPDSLDGLYIPKLHCGFVDATAPHASEPQRFAYDSCYVNLGQFCSPIRSDKTAKYYDQYKQHYRSAYSYLSAAAELKRAEIPLLIGEKERKAAEKRAESSFLRHCDKRKHNGTSTLTQRFLRCIGCRGELCLEDSITTLCKQIYLVDDLCGLERIYLQRVAEIAAKCGCDVLFCPSPLCPERPDAVILPGCALGYVASSAAPGISARHVRLDALIPPAVLREHKAELWRREKLCAELKDAAVFYLRQAKELHDRLEQELAPAMDFAALDAFTEDFTAKLFS